MIPTELFYASELPQHLQTDVTTGRKRKDRVPPLESCPLVEMAQWNCEPDGGVTRCWPVKRWFRRCPNVTVEVTELEAQKSQAAALAMAGFPPLAGR